MNRSSALQRLAKEVIQGNEFIVRKLLALGLDPNDYVWPDDGWTLLHEAIAHSSDLIRVLLDHGANVNAATHLGYTPLMRAAGKGYRDIAELLLARGADLTARDARGATALEMAEAEGQIETAEYLQNVLPDFVVRKFSSDPSYQRLVLVPLDDTSLVLVRLCKSAAGRRVRRLKITFNDGSKLEHVEVLEDCVAVLPLDYAGKSMSEVTVPCDQTLNTVGGHD